MTKPAALPEYQTTQPVTLLPASYGPGQRVRFAGWPEPHKLEPLDEAAKRISSYNKRHARDPFLAPSPWDADRQRFLLLAVLPRMESRNAPALPDNPSPDMPRYVAGTPWRYGPRDVRRGETITFLAWPTPILGLIPENEAAQRVLAYFATFEGNPLLASSPWDEFSAALFLPALRAPRKIYQSGAERWGATAEQARQDRIADMRAGAR